MKVRSLAVAAGMAGLLLGMGVPAAQAKAPIDVEHYTDVFDETFTDCGLDLYVETVATGTFKVRPAPGSTEAFLASNQVRWVDKIYLDAGEGNNPSGDFVTVNGHANFREQKATLVEGNVYRFQQVENGQFRMTASNGSTLLRGNFHIKVDLEFDTEGDGEPGGIEITRNETFRENASGDYCEALTGALT